MAHQIKMPVLSMTLDYESYNWLMANHPDILEAVEAEVNAGHKPEEIRLFVLRQTGRQELAQRCLQAARAAVAMQIEK